MSLSLQIPVPINHPGGAPSDDFFTVLPSWILAQSNNATRKYYISSTKQENKSTMAQPDVRNFFWVKYTTKAWGIHESLLVPAGAPTEEVRCPYALFWHPGLPDTNVMSIRKRRPLWSPSGSRSIRQDRLTSTLICLCSLPSMVP